jgi:hypothetical protein
MRDLLTDPKTTGAVLVSLPEELPVNETLELHAALAQRVKVNTAAVVLNGFVAPRFSEAELSTLGAELKEVARLHESRAHLSAQADERLKAIGVPKVHVPRLYLPSFARPAIEAVAHHLEVVL